MLGFLVVLLSSVFFCVQNVTVRVLFNEHSILGLSPTGGFVAPTLENSFLLLFMRMVLVVPMIAAFASRLHSPTWTEVRSLGSSKRRRVLVQALAGGGLMFLYLALLYVSIGLIPTGIAMTLFFTYPVFTALFSWRWLDSPPSRFRWVVMGFVLIGSVLTLPLPQESVEVPMEATWIGVCTGIAAGMAYALYTVNAQKSFEFIHPVPFTWISFSTTLVLATICLVGWHGSLDQLPWMPLWMGGLVSAIATSVGHLLNNFGIRLIGATSAAMIGATNPALTVVLAWVAIQESLTGLQLAGVLVVTLSVTALSQEHRVLGRQ